MPSSHIYIIDSIILLPAYSYNSTTGPVKTFRPYMAQNNKQKMWAPPKTTTDQFLVTALTAGDASQNEKKIPIALYIMVKMTIGIPARPSSNGPYAICSFGVISRLRSSAPAERTKVE